ncbi:sporulation histidine kinase inhibitor Sda [Paenibacillus elgii]
MASMRSLKDDWLLDCYADAVRLQLDPTFIRLLLNEIHRRLDDPVFRRTWFVLSRK